MMPRGSLLKVDIPTNLKHIDDLIDDRVANEGNAESANFKHYSALPRLELYFILRLERFKRAKEWGRGLQKQDRKACEEILVEFTEGYGSKVDKMHQYYTERKLAEDKDKEVWDEFDRRVDRFRGRFGKIALYLAALWEMSKTSPLFSSTEKESIDSIMVLIEDWRKKTWYESVDVEVYKWDGRNPEDLRNIFESYVSEVEKIHPDPVFHQGMIWIQNLRRNWHRYCNGTGKYQELIEAYSKFVDEISVSQEEWNRDLEKPREWDRILLIFRNYGLIRHVNGTEFRDMLPIHDGNEESKAEAEHVSKSENMEELDDDDLKDLED